MHPAPYSPLPTPNTLQARGVSELEPPGVRPRRQRARERERDRVREKERAKKKQMEGEGAREIESFVHTHAAVMLGGFAVGERGK